MPDINTKTESAPKKSHKPGKNAKKEIASNKIPGEAYSQAVRIFGISIATETNFCNAFQKAGDKGIGSEPTAGLRTGIRKEIVSMKSHKPEINVKKGITAEKTTVGASSQAVRKSRFDRKTLIYLLSKINTMF